MSKVEDFFIAPMEAYFEAIPKDGPRETILHDLDQYSPEDLTQAAEWLKRARQAQSTFPSPKECIKAIKAVVGGRSERAIASYSTITAETYAAAAVKFCAGMQEIPVIKEGEPQWDEWHAYWQWLGARWVLDLVRDRKSWTVPTYFPSQFDPRFQFMNAKPFARAA